MIVAVMVLMTVSVQPAMAAQEINDEIESNPGAALGLTPVSAYGHHKEPTVNIREIQKESLLAATAAEPAGTLPTASEAEMYHSGPITLNIQDPLIEQPLSEAVSAMDITSADEGLAAEFTNMSDRGFALTGESTHRYESLVTSDDFLRVGESQKAHFEQEGFVFDAADKVRSYRDVTYYTFTNATTGDKAMIVAVQRLDTAANPIGNREIAVSPDYSGSATMAAAGDSSHATQTCWAGGCAAQWIAIVLCCIGLVLTLISLILTLSNKSAGTLSDAFTHAVCQLLHYTPVDGFRRITDFVFQLRGLAIIGEILTGIALMGVLAYCIYDLGVCACWWEAIGTWHEVVAWDYQYKFLDGDNGKEVPINMNDRIAVALFADTVNDTDAHWVLDAKEGFIEKESLTTAIGNGTTQAWLFEARTPGTWPLKFRYDTSKPVPPTVAGSRYTLTVNVSPGTWKIETVDMTDNSKGTGLYTSLAIDNGGTPHISYLAPSAGGVKYATRTGGTWAVTTVAGSRDTWRTSIDLSPEGYPAFTYGDDAPNIGDMNYAYWNGSVWQWEHIQTPDNWADARRIGLFNSFKFDPAGVPHAAYSSCGTWGNLMYATRQNGTWVRTTVDGVGNTGYNPSLMFTSDGRPCIAYRTGNHASLMYAEQEKTGDWKITWVDDSQNWGYTGHFASLALDSHDNPQIAYYDDMNHNFHYASRNETGAWNKEMIANVGDVGSWNSLVIDASDQPYISYYDASLGYLKLATRYPGTDTWTIRIVDNDGNVGACTSIALTPEGKPGISYLDYTHHALKYAEWQK